MALAATDCALAVLSTSAVSVSSRSLPLGGAGVEEQARQLEGRLEEQLVV